MSVKRKAWDLNPHDPKVARFSKPARRAVSGYLPYVFKCQWTDRELNPDFRHARAVSSRWTISPKSSGPDRSRTDHTDLARISRLHRHAGPFIERSVRESNPISVLTTDVCYRNTYRPISKVIADGIEPSISWLSPRRLCRWTTRSSVTEVGVEPTKSPRSRRDRYACLRTRP